MQEVKISVIMPVYNAEPYLRKAIGSITVQTHKNLEIILVDDGSTDGSADICDSCAAADNRIRVIHKLNEGQAKARNIALDIATGDYIGFVDSDDSIHPDTYEYSLRLMLSQQADAVLFDCFMSEDPERQAPVLPEQLLCLQGEQILPYFMTESTRQGRLYSPCLCLYRRAVLGNLRFREGKIYEDQDFKLKFIRACQTIVVSNQIKYYYLVTGDSTTSGRLGLKNFDIIESDAIIYELTSNDPNPIVRQMGAVKKARTPFTLLGRMARYGVREEELNENETAARLLPEHRKNLPILLRAPIGWKRKLLAILLALNYKLARTILRPLKNIY